MSESDWLAKFLEEDFSKRQADAPPFDPVLEALCAGLPEEDARFLREERAAILEHEAGLTRNEAEHMAGLKALHV